MAAARKTASSSSASKPGVSKAPNPAARRGAPGGRFKPSSAFLAAHKAAESSLAMAVADDEKDDGLSAPMAAPRTFSNLKKGPQVQTVPKETGDGVHPKMLQQAKRTGQLNLSGRGLTVVPDKVWRINEVDEEERRKASQSLSMDRVDESTEGWWDYVDLTKLILASNKLSILPPDVGELLSLTVLDLHDNELESLPDEIGKLENLARINLNHNKLKRLPQDFFSLRSLRSLSVANNSLIELHDDISRLDELESLDLSHNELKSLPPSIGYLTKMTNFNLSQNKLKELPSEISFLRDLTTLELTNNSLEELPESMCDLSKLECLYLRHNSLTRLPNLRNCSHLKEMHLGNNRLTEVTSEDIGKMPNVHILDLRDNKIASVPEEIVNLQSLERLDLGNNDLHAVPYFIGTLPHLKSFSLEGNPLKTIRRDIIQRGTVGLLKYLRSRLTAEDLEQLREKGNVSPDVSTLGSSPPVPDKYALKTSQSLNMSKKEIASLPLEAAENAVEAGVTGVDLSKNYFEEVPEELKLLLPTIFEVNMSANRLSSVPSWLGGLGARVQYLNLGNNKLAELPDEIGEMKELREVAVPYNRFTQVPQCLYSCPKLESIVICGNQVCNY